MMRVVLPAQERPAAKGNRRMQQSEAQESAELLRAVVETAVDGIITIEQNGSIRTFNPAAERIFGYLAPEVVGQNVNMLMPEPYHSEHDEYLGHYIRTGERRIIGKGREVEGRRKDGSRFPLELAVSETRLHDRLVFTGIVRDISGRKKAEADLNESRQRLHGIIASATDAIITVDSEQLITLFNSAAEKMFGCPAEAAIGSRLDRFIPLRLRDAHRGHIARFGDTGVSAGAMGGQRALIALRSDGREFPVEATISQITVGGNRLFTAIIRDVTERHRAEEELALRASELVRSNTELERFAYIASHDLQEPMRSVSNFAQLLRRRYKGKLDSDADEFIDFITQGVERMKKLIEDLLAYSRVGSQGAALEPTRSGDVLGRVLEDMRARIESSGAIITHDAMPVVRADATQLGQVFQNLIANAVKFRGEGRTPKVHISAMKSGNECEFGVKDNGIGISPEYFERIFQIFQRLHTIEEYAGTGIGLAICKRIVERHGGRIWVESAPGAGSTFKFTIPQGRTG